MAQEFETDEELADYRVVLSCIRKRLERYGMLEAVESLKRLDHQLLQAIVDHPPPPDRRAIN